MKSLLKGTSGRAPQLLAFTKTDEFTQALTESSNQLVLAFPIESQPKPLAFWLRGQELVVDSISFWCQAEYLLLLFFRQRKEGEQTFRSVRNLKRLGCSAS